MYPDKVPHQTQAQGQAWDPTKAYSASFGRVANPRLDVPLGRSPSGSLRKCIVLQCPEHPREHTFLCTLVGERSRWEARAPRPGDLRKETSKPSGQRQGASAS